MPDPPPQPKAQPQPRHSVRPFRLSRRHLLRGLGATVALPYLEPMMASSVMASPKPVIPPRLGFFYFGTGMNMREFTPATTGPDYQFTRILKPLERHRDDFSVLSGTYLAHGGGHDGAYPFATAVARGERQRISPDQIAARQLGEDTRYPSLTMSVARGTNLGSQALATISWNEQGVPLPADNDPKAIFDRMFRPDSDEVRAGLDTEFRRKGSVLDVVMDDAKRLNQQLGHADREQMDQYLNSIRELERALERRIEWADRPKPKLEIDNLHEFEESMVPEGNGDFLYDDYGRMMYDLIALAFQTDSTRIASYVVRTELAGGVYPEFGVSKGYHSLTHHGNDPRNLEELAAVDVIYMTHWAHLIDRLKAVRQPDGTTLLDHTLLGYSSGMGFDHSRDRLPTVLTGGRALGVRHGGHLDLDRTPLASLWHTMLDRAGVDPGPGFQDSTGVIADLVA